MTPYEVKHDDPDLFAQRTEAEPSILSSHMATVFCRAGRLVFVVSINLGILLRIVNGSLIFAHAHQYESPTF